MACTGLEALISADSRAGRWAPWLEGLCLGGGVLLVLLLGGEVVRMSYHGLLHTSIGEAVLRDGLRPENPYHAGSPLRYYTLYPLLGSALGRLGCGPLAVFAAFNVIAGVLFAPALDALGRAFRLGFLARRATLLAAVFGYNAIGWVGWLMADLPPAGEVPVFTFEAMTWAEASWGWDARLQAFLPKFLNVSSFGLALPFALWALAAGADEGARARRCVLPAAAALAINPLVGAWTGLVLLVWTMPRMLLGKWRQKLAWPAAGALAVAMALPFLLPALGGGPDGPSLTGQVRFQHTGFGNLLGPLLLLLLPGMLGLLRLPRSGRPMWMFAFVLTAAALLVARLPWGNEYKLARLAGVLWALPVGVWAAQCIAVAHQQGRRMPALLPLALLAVSLPTTVLCATAYVRWGGGNTAPLITHVGGRLQVRASSSAEVLPAAIAAAEATAPADAVLLLHPFQPGTRADGGVVQGNALAPVFHHPLDYDHPQIHNDRLPDLRTRLDQAALFWVGTLWGGGEAPAAGTTPGGMERSGGALQSIRERHRTRPLLVLAPPQTLPQALKLLRAQGEPRATANGFSLWLLPALDPPRPDSDGY